MRILIVGNVLRDIYLNLDSRTEHLEEDKNGVKWLDVSFDASEHHFFSQNTSLGGAAVTFEVLSNLGLDAKICNSDLTFTDEGLSSTTPVESTRYILIADEAISYLSPSSFKATPFTAPSDSFDYLYIDRSATLTRESCSKIHSYLDSSPDTKLILYIRQGGDPFLTELLPRAQLVFRELGPSQNESSPQDQLTPQTDPNLTVNISQSCLSYLKISEPISINRINMMTHLSAYSIASATILGAFILGYSVEESLRFAKTNVENSRLNSTLPISKLQNASSRANTDSLSIIASSLLMPPKGILAADESGGSIHKKFEQLNIPDTYDNRRDYRNLFFTTPDLEKYVNGVILFDETAHQIADNGQNFVDYLIAKRIIPGIKVDQGYEKYSDSMPPASVASDSPAHPEETWTKGLSGLPSRLATYYQMGLRFAKWRAAFDIRLDENGDIITPTVGAIETNCRILAEYAKSCQSANIVPIVEPEVVYDGNYNIDQCALMTNSILDTLFKALSTSQVNLSACILKVNMVQDGKQHRLSTPEEVATYTAKTLKDHVPDTLAGVVFLSGGQTVEQATDNLKAIVHHGPFPWPVTFSFARALQDPALYAWAGDNTKANEARDAFLARLIANTEALK